MRNQEEHEQYCSDILTNAELSKEYGVNRRSILLDLQYFDVCDRLLPDVMHDLLEGGLQYEAKLLLQHCIEENYFSRKTLNYKIEVFDFGCAVEANRPTTIPHKTLYSADNLLKQKGWFKKSLYIFLTSIFLYSNSDVDSGTFSTCYGWEVCTRR